MATIITVATARDAYGARRSAKETALAIGFDEKASEEIAIAVSELAANLIKYARGGRLTLVPIDESAGAGIQVESLDVGPGIADVELALSDGFSTGGGLGHGLGAVNRFMDQFDISSQCGSDAGTHIVCKRWLRRRRAALDPCPLDFGVATRSHAAMTVNGDAFVVKRWDARALVSVIDGLGHGQEAHRAAQAARHFVETHFDQPLEGLFRGVDRACRSTRGVVMALVKFNFTDRNIRFSFASIGNVEARIGRGCAAERLPVRRGVLGAKAPAPQVTEHVWETSNVLVLHSDGLKQRWNWDQLGDFAKQPAAKVAQCLLRAQAKENDDATVVIVKDANCE
ncbi:MAG: ATP-binding protein [Candidatus Binatia bacterium]